MGLSENANKRKEALLTTSRTIYVSQPQLFTQFELKEGGFFMKKVIGIFLLIIVICVLIFSVYIVYDKNYTLGKINNYLEQKGYIDKY